MLSREFHRSRRERYHEMLSDGQMGVLFAGSPKKKAGDEDYPFSVYRNFYYLTGCEEPETVYLAYKNGGRVREMLFIRRPNEGMETFEGHRPRPDEAKELFGISQVRYLDELESSVSGIMSWYPVTTLWLDLEERQMDRPSLERNFARRMRDCYPTLAVADSYDWFAKQRRVKDAEEIAKHREACDVTAEAVQYMMRHMRPGMTEGQIEAYFDFIVKTRGCDHAFETIAAAGKNACTLHYSVNRDTAKDGDMILFDLGASSGYYCADVSRTFPVNGKFTARQKQLYDIVLKGLDAALEAARPGQIKDDLQKISWKVMAQELVRIGMIEKEEEMSKYYLHSSGHFIGLYTHDVGEDPALRLEKDMVFTLEPGLYFPEENLGIRIEDTLLVTEDGCEVLSGAIPKTTEEIEAFMAQGADGMA